MAHEVVNGAEFEQLSTGHGDCEEPAADKPLLHSEQSVQNNSFLSLFDPLLRTEHHESEPPKADFGDAANQSACPADVKPDLSPTAETNTSCAKNVDPKTSFGMLCMKLEQFGNYFTRLCWLHRLDISTNE